MGTPLWSPLEHGCHVRDMCLLFHSGLDAMLGGGRIAPSKSSEAHGPRVLRRYREEEPRQVAAELERAADALAARLASLTEADLRHRAPGPADSRLTVDFFARHLLHDIAHDLAEIRRGDRSTATRRKRP
ncbi:DinB family protein [Streptomyces mayteni]